MNIGGMQITDGATYAPTRTEEPPGTMRTPSDTEKCRAGNVSLSTKLNADPPISVSSPRRKPSRMPCFTHVLTTQRPSIFSAARIFPWVRASRNSRKAGRASGLCSTSPIAARRSMEDFKDCIRLLDALALAADQDAGHAMSNFASMDERGIGSMPSRVIGVVAGGPAPALIALPARAAMQHDLMRTGRPIFIDIKFRRLRRCRRSLRNEPRIHGYSLQLRSRIAAHGQERQSIVLFNSAHHRKHGLYRKRTGFDKVGLHQRQIFAVNASRRSPIVVERGAGQACHLVRNFIRCHGNDS